VATTFELIRTQQVALIQALTPTMLAAQKFRVHQDSAEFMAWVNGSPKACFRKFQILSNFDMEQLPTADGTIEACRHTFELRVAYPTQLGLYGAENERDLEDAMKRDLHQIDAAIGLNGGAAYVTNQDLCERKSQTVIDGVENRVLSITYFIQYDRSV